MTEDTAKALIIALTRLRASEDAILYEMTLANQLAIRTHASRGGIERVEADRKRFRDQLVKEVEEVARSLVGGDSNA